MGMALVTACALALASLGFGATLLGVGSRTAPPRIDAVSALTGLAVLTALMGWPVLCGVYSIGAAWPGMGVGVALLARCALRMRRSAPSRLAPRDGGEPRGARIAAWVLRLVSFGLIAATCLGGLQSVVYNACDDWPGYFHLPRLMLETGGYVEPFSLRRMSSLGAVPFLQGLFWNDLGVAGPGVADGLVGQGLLWASVRTLPSLGAGDDRRPPVWLGEAFALLALLLSFSLVVWNTTPVVLPMAGTLVLAAMSFELSHRAGTTGGLALAAAWGFVAAWLIGIRLNGAPLPATLWALAGAVALTRRDRALLLRVVVAGAATGLGLLPWCLSLWQSSGTPLFPLVPGHLRVPDLNVAGLDLAAWGLAIAEGLMDGRVWAICLCAALASCVAGHRRTSVGLTASILVMMAATTATSTGFERITTYRYSAPFALGGLLFLGVVSAASFATWLRRDRPTAQRRRGALGLVVLVAVCIAWLVVPFEYPRGRERTLRRHSNLETLAANLARRSGGLRKTLGRWSGSEGFAVFAFRGAELHARAQATLPADARVVSATTSPFLFRFDRQTIHTLDLLGVVGPDPGWPIGEGPEALADYFVGLGYTHLMFSPPRQPACLYSLSGWSRNRTSDEPYLRKLAPLMIDAMENERRLARSRRILFRSQPVVVVDLLARRPSDASARGRGADATSVGPDE